MHPTQLPIIDWDKNLQLAGGDKELATEMLQLFLASLSNDIAAINQAYTNQDYAQLANKIHRLHGIVCYLGLPRLKQVIVTLETELKTNIITNLPSSFIQLHTEVNLLLGQHSLLT